MTKYAVDVVLCLILGFALRWACSVVAAVERAVDFSSAVEYVQTEPTYY